MRKWKQLLAVFVAGIQITGVVPANGIVTKAYAEEPEEIREEAEMLGAPAAIDESVYFENLLWESGEGSGEDVPMLQSVDYNDLSTISFQISDIRDASKVSTFNGADGKQAIIVFGSITTCINTQKALKSLTELTSKVDMSKLNIYVFDIYRASEENILSRIGDVSDQIIINSTNNSWSYSGLFGKCRDVTIGSGAFVMPLIVYKGTDGKIYEFTTAEHSLAVMEKYVEMGGLKVNGKLPDSKQILKVTGQTVYEEAYKVLDLVNQERAKEGLNALVMDEELLEAAMLRAAECSLYFNSSHTRPNGTTGLSASPKIFGENIARGYKDAESVMANWMGSPGHRANILGTSYYSVGIGCFCINGHYTWTQCFGIRGNAMDMKKTSQIVTYAVEAVSYHVAPILLEDSGTLNVGETKQLQIGADQSYYYTYINADSYQWDSDSDVATVSADGIITAKKAGTAIITGTNIGDPSAKVIYILTVQDKTALTYGDANGDGSINSLDAVMIKRYLAGYEGLTIDLAATDVNADGRVNSLDAVKILQKLAGYEVVLGEK